MDSPASVLRVTQALLVTKKSLIALLPAVIMDSATLVQHNTNSNLIHIYTSICYRRGPLLLGLSVTVTLATLEILVKWILMSVLATHASMEPLVL